MQSIVCGSNHLAYVLTVKDFASNSIILIIHGAFLTKNSCFYPDLSSSLPYNSLRIDLEGNGDSEGSFSVGNYINEAENINSAVLWCQSNGFKVICIIGHSKGANVTLIYSSIYSCVPKIVSIAARYNMKAPTPFLSDIADEVNMNGRANFLIHGKNYVVTKEALQEKHDLDMKGFSENVHADVCIIHGNADEVISMQDALDLRISLGDKCKELKILPYTSHFFENEIDELTKIIAGFIAK